jgi:hypothetical protein
MLTILGTIFSSIFSGGATGIIGVIAQRFADYKNKQLDMQLEAQRHANAVALRRVDAEIMAQEWAARTKVAEVEGETAKEVADAAAFGKSFEMEPQRYSGEKLTPNQQWVMVALDAFRGAVRPMLTVYLCVLTTLIYILARQKVQAEDLTSGEALELLKLIIGSILYLTTTCVLWWFGTRNKNKGAD